MKRMETGLGFGKEEFLGISMYAHEREERKGSRRTQT